MRCKVDRLLSCAKAVVAQSAATARESDVNLIIVS